MADARSAGPDDPSPVCGPRSFSFAGVAFGTIGFLAAFVAGVSFRTPSQFSAGALGLGCAAVGLVCARAVGAAVPGRSGSTWQQALLWASVALLVLPLVLHRSHPAPVTFEDRSRFLAAALRDGPVPDDAARALTQIMSDVDWDWAVLLLVDAGQVVAAAVDFDRSVISDRSGCFVWVPGRSDLVASDACGPDALRAHGSRRARVFLVSRPTSGSELVRFGSRLA